MRLRGHLVSSVMVTSLVAAHAVLHANNGIACELLQAKEPITIDASGDASVLVYRLKNHDQYQLPSAIEFRQNYKRKHCKFSWSKLVGDSDPQEYRIEDFTSDHQSVIMSAKDILNGDEVGIICTAASQIGDAKTKVKVHFGSAGLTWSESRYTKALTVVVMVGWAMVIYSRRHLKQDHGLSLVSEMVIAYGRSSVILISVRWGWLVLREVLHITLDSGLASVINQMTLRMMMGLLPMVVKMALYYFSCGYGTLYYTKDTHPHPHLQRMPDSFIEWERNAYILLMMSMPPIDMSASPVRLLVLPDNTPGATTYQVVTSVVYGITGFAVGVKTMSNFVKTRRQLQQVPDGKAPGNGTEIAVKFNESMVVVLVFLSVVGDMAAISVIAIVALVPTNSDPVAVYEALWSSRGWMAMSPFAAVSTLVEFAMMHYLWVRDNHGLL